MKNLVWLTALMFACGPRATSPESMSAKAHEEAAVGSETRANLKDVWGEAGNVVLSGPLRVSDSSAWRAHADAHREAAETLQKQEREACGTVSGEERAVCPLMEYEVLASQATPKGVRVTFKGAGVTSLGAHVQCHHAFGAREGREGMPGCPLYSVDLRTSVEPHVGGATLVLESDDADTIKRVQSIYELTPSK